MNATNTPLIPNIYFDEISREIDKFVASLSSLKGRIEAGEDIWNTISQIETELPQFLSKLKKNNNEQLHSVMVEWEGDFKIDEVLQMTKTDDYGLYQIYGDHAVYGPCSLLYIGETDKTFGQRIADHKSEWLQDQDVEKVRIHVGRIVSYYDEYDRKQLIKDTEALTIYKHQPARNSKNIDRYNGRLLKVVNTGEYGNLHQEYVSSNLSR